MRKPMREIIPLDLIRSTDEAYLVSDGTKEVWLPKSQADDNEDGTFDVEEWIAIEKGLI